MKNPLIIKLQAQPFKFSKTKGGLLVVTLFCFVLMITLDYDNDYVLTALLPLAYFILLLLCVGRKILNNGLGTVALLFFYCFRMCILPVICALGNFYLEPNKSDYIDKYDIGIYLTIFEAIVVFLSLSYFCDYYGKKEIGDKFVSKDNNQHRLLLIVTGALTVFIILVCFLYQISYFHFITEEAAEILVDDVLPHQEMHAMWYITDLACILWRPLFSFILIYKLLNMKKKKKAYILISLIALINILFMSDRRIFALLVGGFCFYYLMTLLKSKMAKRCVQISIVICAFLTILYCFYGSMTTGLWVVARTFQRYFSGPTLTAMALEVNDNIGLQFSDFFKLLLNDFQLYTGLMGAFSLPDYYYPIFGMSKGIWTPMVAGSLRYFGFFFPIVIICFVRYIVNCDYNAQRTNDKLYKMLYSYLGVTVSCYMIMYSVELIVYFILSIALIYRILVLLDSRRIKFLG